LTMHNYGNLKFHSFHILPYVYVETLLKPYLCSPVNVCHCSKASLLSGVFVLQYLAELACIFRCQFGRTGAVTRYQFRQTIAHTCQKQGN
jgi:hypothetical protein